MEVGAAGASVRQLIARDANAVTILDRHDYAQQYQRRERDDGVQRLVRGATTHGQGRNFIRRGANDQFAQLVDYLGRCY
jgi:hypothetical protein